MSDNPDHGLNATAMLGSARLVEAVRGGAAASPVDEGDPFAAAENALAQCSAIGATLPAFLEASAQLARPLGEYGLGPAPLPLIVVGSAMTNSDPKTIVDNWRDAYSRVDASQARDLFTHSGPIAVATASLRSAAAKASALLGQYAVLHRNHTALQQSDVEQRAQLELLLSPAADPMFATLRRPSEGAIARVDCYIYKDGAFGIPPPDPVYSFLDKVKVSISRRLDEPLFAYSLPLAFKGRELVDFRSVNEDVDSDVLLFNVISTKPQGAFFYTNDNGAITLSLETGTLIPNPGSDMSSMASVETLVHTIFYKAATGHIDGATVIKTPREFLQRFQNAAVIATVGEAKGDKNRTYAFALSTKPFRCEENYLSTGPEFFIR